jgi:hypothetical protein
MTAITSVYRYIGYINKGIDTVDIKQYKFLNKYKHIEVEQNRSYLNKAYTSNGRNKYALKYEQNHLVTTNKERFVQGQNISSQENVNTAVPNVSNQGYIYTTVNYRNTVRVRVRNCTVQVYGDQSERNLQRKICMVMVCERMLNTKQEISSTGEINNGKIWHVSEKCTKVTESDKMSSQPTVDQEMKDLERKDGKNTATLPGMCARVLSLRVLEKIRVLSLRVLEKIRILCGTYWSNKSSPGMKNTATPPGMCARVLSLRVLEKIRVLSLRVLEKIRTLCGTYWSNKSSPIMSAGTLSTIVQQIKRKLGGIFWSHKSRKVCVQSGNWHRDYGE